MNMNLAIRTKTALLCRTSDKSSPGAVDSRQPTPPLDSPGQPPAVAGFPFRPAVADPGHLLPDGFEGRHLLKYPEAVEAFLPWLQAKGETGVMSRNRLMALYNEHCDELGLAVLPDNYFFAELKKRAKRGECKISGRGAPRKRVTTYDIPRQSRATEATPIKKWRAA